MTWSDLLNDPTYAVAIAAAVAVFLAGALFRQRKEVAFGLLSLAALCGIWMLGNAVREENAPPSAIQELPKQLNELVGNEPQKSKEKDTDVNIVDQFLGHDNPPQVKADPVKQQPSIFPGPGDDDDDVAPAPDVMPPTSDTAEAPPPTFDPDSAVASPKFPYPRVNNPNRQMPVTLRPVETPKDFVPQGQPQTVHPMELRLIIQPNGTFQWIWVPTRHNVVRPTR